MDLPGWESGVGLAILFLLSPDAVAKERQQEDGSRKVPGEVRAVNAIRMGLERW